ncbi:hypothetical protein VARIO8X_50362 [Burkholderiales bacterium 8X]|nr:hypothetical protein VARIO8X_50362 [Burkholderiales bacterium 8X]
MSERFRHFYLVIAATSIHNYVSHHLTGVRDVLQDAGAHFHRSSLY